MISTIGPRTSVFTEARSFYKLLPVFEGAEAAGNFITFSPQLLMYLFMYT